MIEKRINVFIVPDESVLHHPCKEEYGYSTTRELSVLNNKNRNCLLKYKEVVDSTIKWIEEQKLILTKESN